VLRAHHRTQPGGRLIGRFFLGGPQMQTDEGTEYPTGDHDEDSAMDPEADTSSRRTAGSVSAKYQPIYLVRDVSER